ncbi:MAG: hypothetical protein UU23_C0007G0005 [Candidatus Curtissbacteria bacterium GW2011_GWA1_40_9]|uniref:Uncharacterized protein n=1 Tax=Candidatus Curtissbacteria bacterium GW2011_GWA1_40_9 TaxID=1618408 RepID=A0A0G0WRA6_9BACT|nr:MAG: hypothetical protein UU23_C0007G0005 [Candidatus Curtissbacteria bacterium GW2011_GWA1_40_9]
MRDLARQNLRTRSRSEKNYPRALRLGIVVALIVGVVLFVNSGVGLPIVGGSDVMLRDAQHGLIPVEVSDGPIGVEGGIDLISNKATFRNVGNIKASASAERVYGAGSFTMTVNATFSGEKGHRYQVWFTDGSAQADAGFMEGSGNSWTLVFRDKDKGYSDMDGIWITDELTTEDNRAEKHLLEGTF